MKPNDFRYLDNKDDFLKYSYLALSENFDSRNDFDAYFAAIETNERKNLFLRTATFYLFLVKCGNWEVDVPDSNKNIDYATNTYKHIAIFSLIESLSEHKYIDFYDYLRGLNSGIIFPISKKELGGHYRNVPIRLMQVLVPRPIFH